MGLMDAFTADARVEMKVGDLYDVLRVAASNEKKVEYLINAIKCEVPYNYIREIMTGKKEETAAVDGICIKIPRDILDAAFGEAQAAAREMLKGLDLEKEGASVKVTTEITAGEDGESDAAAGEEKPLSDCAPENVSCEECPNKEICDGNAQDIAGMADEVTEESEGGENGKDTV